MLCHLPKVLCPVNLLCCVVIVLLYFQEKVQLWHINSSSRRVVHATYNNNGLIKS